jgi:microcystin-dependent protein
MDPFVAEIRILPTTFAPSGWANCDGQLLAITQNTALFSLVGTIYGGNGQSTFGLPDFQGRVPMHHGQGQGLSQRVIGEASGSTTITLLESEIPVHTHSIVTVNAAGDSNLASNNGLARSTNASVYNVSSVPLVLMAPQALTPNGGSFPHNNLQPYLTLRFVIALQGIYPQHP